MHLSPVRSLSAVSALALTALTAACGSATDSPSPAAFPVTLWRKGGVAGLDQRIVVAQDGRATATGRGAGSACTLDESAKADLDAVAQGVTGTAKTTYEHPDDLFVVVQTSRGSARLDDLDRADRAAVVTRLFEDLFGAPAERAVCR